MRHALLAGLLASALMSGPSFAQGGGFAVGKTVTFTNTSGTFTGSLIELAPKPPEITIVTTDGKATKVQLNTITSFRRTGQRKSIYWAGSSANYDLFDIGGYGIYAIHSHPHFTIKLPNGKTERFHTHSSSLKSIAVSAAGNVSGGSAGTGGSTAGPATPYRDPGESHAEAAWVDYPSRVDGYMSSADYDTFRFKFAGGALNIRASSGLNLVADLLDASGKPIARAIGGNFQISRQLPRGDYGIQIRVMQHAGTGNYTLTFGSGGGRQYRESR